MSKVLKVTLVALCKPICRARFFDVVAYTAWVTLILVCDTRLINGVTEIGTVINSKHAFARWTLWTGATKEKSRFTLKRRVHMLAWYVAGDVIKDLIGYPNTITVAQGQGIPIQILLASLHPPGNWWLTLRATKSISKVERERTRKSSCVNARGIPPTTQQVLTVLQIIK